MRRRTEKFIADDDWALTTAKSGVAAACSLIASVVAADCGGINDVNDSMEDECEDDGVGSGKHEMDVVEYVVEGVVVWCPVSMLVR